MNKFLDRIYNSSSLYELCGFIVNRYALREALDRSSEVRDLREAFQTGAVTAQEIRNFVSNILFNLKYGEIFEGDLFLAAVSVALEQFPHNFAEEFVHELASLSLVELPISIDIAKISQDVRLKLIKNHSKTIILSTAVSGSYGAEYFSSAKPVSEDDSWKDINIYDGFPHATT